MATWTQIAGTIANSTKMSSIVTDKIDNIYFVPSTSTVKVYNVSGDTVTTIGNNSWSGGTIPHSLHSGFENCLAYFKNNLYVIIEGTTTTVEVWKYDGTGTSWTKVFGQDIGDAMTMIFDEDYMVACGYNTPSNNGHTTTSYYTANGTSWSAATIDIEVGYGDTGTGVPAIAGSSHIQNSRVISAMFTERLAAGSITNIYEFNGSTGAWVNVATDLNFYGARNDFNWRFFGTYQYSTTYTGYSVPTDGAIEPIRCQNIEDSVGIKVVGSSVTFYAWDTGDWAITDTSFTLTGGTSPIMVRFNNTEIFIIIRDSSSNWHIYQRSEGYGAPVVGDNEGRLWLYKSTDKGLTWSNRGVKT